MIEAIEKSKTLAKPFEGYSPKVYLCPAGYWTIAWGHRCGKDHPPISIEQGEIYLSADMMKALRGAIKYCPTLISKPDKLAAITDFCFNLGVGRLQTSTLKRKINAEDWAGARQQLMKWIYGGGRKLNGLVKRRAAEALLMN